MAASGGFLRRSLLAFACLLLQLAIPVTSAEGHCIWYGQCSHPPEYKKVNCAYNGTALPIEESTQWILEKYCPDIAAGGAACCNSEQLSNLQQSITLATSILSRCPSCLDNFLKHICALTCATNQSLYLKPVKVEPFNATHERILEIDYHLSNRYMSGTFNSCAQVLVPSSNQLSMDVMCGEYGSAGCTPQRWFTFMGDASSPFVPFQINYIGGDEPSGGFTPADPPTRACNVGLRNVDRCSCLECDASCSSPWPRTRLRSRYPPS